jgi:hypothetical protein
MKQHEWQIGDKFIAPNWDDKIVMEVHEVGGNYVSAKNPDSIIKLHFSKTSIVYISPEKFQTNDTKSNG